MKIKITKCSNPILWYSKYIGQEFEVTRIEDKAYWVLEPEWKFRCINWVHSEDCTITDTERKA